MHRRQLPLLLLVLISSSSAPSAWAQQDASCAFDLDGNGLVSTDDLLWLLGAFGREASASAAAARADANGDGLVSTDDLLGLLATFGRPCASENPPPAPPATLEDLLEEFAHAALDALDPFAPLVAVSSSISVEGDLALFEDLMEDADARVQFEQGFADAMAANLGDGSTVRPEMVIVDDVRQAAAVPEPQPGAGRRRLQSHSSGPVIIEVLFHLLLPESLQSAGTSLIAMMEETGQQIDIIVPGATFVANTDSLADATVLPAVVNCEGSWVPSENECTERCGPYGVIPQTFVVTRAEQNGGSNCADAETVPDPLPCNTHLQCPVDCSGEWSPWGDCSLPCGSGTQTRNYVVLQEQQHGGAACPEQDTSQSQECNTDPCPPPPPQGVDCVGSWSQYSECSHTCGPDGLQQRVFTISQVASNGGTACAQAAGATESRSCNTAVQCPVDCEGEWSDFGPCSEVCGPGVRTRQFQVTAAAQNGGECPEADSVQSEGCDNLCPIGLSETDVAPGPISLPVTGAFELATLVKLPDDPTELRASAVPVARSYNGNDWEGTMPSPVSFECTATAPVTCSTTLPAGATYQLRTYDGTGLVSRDPKRFASRFLTQATFGPTLDEIESFSAATLEETEAAVEGWIIAQMEMEPTLHRVYLRRRTNHYTYNDPRALVRDPCSEASSWVTFAFSKFDQGKKVDVSLNADGSYSLSVEGIVRTVVQSTKDIREDDGWSCFKRGFRTPLDMPGASVTVEPSVEACHQRCVSTAGCAYFSLNEDTMECHLQNVAAGNEINGAGGPWRTGPTDCSSTTFQYPPVEQHPGLWNAGLSCWGPCWHGPCPDRCGPNGFCCKYGRDVAGCVTTDPTATSHRCILDPSIPPPPPGPAPRLQANTTYTVCFVNEYEGGDVSLLLPGINWPGIEWQQSGCPMHINSPNQIIIGNPPVNLQEPNPYITQQLDGIAMVPSQLPLRDSYTLRNPVDSCELPPNPTVFIYHGEKYYRHEPRVQLVENTVDNPYIEERSMYKANFCPAAKPTFVNVRGCVRQNSCSSPVWTEGTVALTDELMRQFYTHSQKYVYSIVGLSLDGFSTDQISACSVQTRWKKTAGACDADTLLDGATLASLSAALRPVGNASLTEVVLETPDIMIIGAVQGECATELNNVSIVGAKVTIDGTCYEQVHPDSYNVYDMAYLPERFNLYGARDFGCNRDCRNRQPLTRPADRGGTELDVTTICDSGVPGESSSCWFSGYDGFSGARQHCRLLGVLGQEVDFNALPVTVQVPWVAELAGVEDISLDLSAGVTESCGALGEVANDPAYGHKFGDRREYTQKPVRDESAAVFPNALVLADDQLRQRVAWALSQIYVLASAGYEGNPASLSQYYDILVRNAFGNFRTLIKEVAYSEPMSVMLTYRDSKSAAYSGDFADENFARECIQLFTVGTEHLNPDGTFVLDDEGNHVRTYGVKDVASFARTWTGFVATGGRRGRGRSNTINVHVDSLDIVPAYRDASPKMDLFDGFIGDGYPLCVDLPKRPFLRKGFTYVYRGSTPDDLGSLTDDDGVLPLMTVDSPSSALFQALCVPADGACTFPSEVTLAQSLPCFRHECGKDRAPIVHIVDGSGTDAYYEAMEFACTRLSFFNDGQFMKYGAPYINKMSCADPRSDAAAPLCCSRADLWNGTGTATCEYQRERVTYATAAERCASQNKEVCQGSVNVNGWSSCHPFSRWRFSTWMGRSCSTQVQVQRDGRVGAVHAGVLVDNSDRDSRTQPESIADVLSTGSKSVFDVVWSEDSYPKVEDNCSPSCTVLGETCLCDVVATSVPVFTGSHRIPTASEVKALPVGALDPTAYDAGQYARCDSVLCTASDVVVWSRRMRMHETLETEIEEINVALNKPTTASSTCCTSLAAYIVDGNTESSPFRSEATGEQWVQVDLEEDTYIDSVNIVHRSCSLRCQQSINGARIIISDTSDFSTGTQCGGAVMFTPGSTATQCWGMYGRFVTVVHSDASVQMNELEVFAEAIQTADGYVFAPTIYEFIETTEELVFNEDTIFEVQGDDGASKFFKNQDVRVIVDDNSFRNPPTFMDYAHPTERQALLETDAVLDHLTTHPSTAPFICKKLIQFFTSSNPSPRYVLEVATAFRTGAYAGRVYSGEYGDLAATIAAILMDREARDETLDLDPAAGKLREPLLKVWHVMRSLEFQVNRNQLIGMNLMNRIGQQFHRASSIFSFFEPDFAPAGRVAKAAINAPEAEILTIPYIIGYMNGIASLVDKGLSHCAGGFGAYVPSHSPHLYMPTSCGDNQAAKLTADGYLSYEYQNRAGDIVSELALLLTGGREPPAVRALWDRSQTQYVNVALNRPTSSSSRAAEVVVDGVTDTGLFVSPECSGEQWLQVDLGDVIEIDNVQLYHRMDCCGEQMDGATVLVGDTPDFTRGVQCGAPVVFTGDPVTNLLCPGVSGRYVTVRQEGTCLQVVELEVIAVRTGTIGEPECKYIPPREVCYELRCGGDAGQCAEPNTCAQPTELHEVGCCADAPIAGFQRRYPDTCPVWGMRTVARVCQHALNYADAAAWCASFGGRLCTAQEHENDCTRGTGCAHDVDLIWSSTEQVTLLPVDPNGPATCDAVTALEDETACVAAGCRYRPRVPTHPVPSEADLLPDLIKLFAFSSEFAATNQNVLREHPRPVLPPVPSQNRPYKALIVILLKGGADSWNILIPHSGCVRDLYAEYAQARSNLAFPLDQILPLDLADGSPAQPCTTYATHPSLGKVKQLWDAGQASFFANIGTLIKPIDRFDFIRGDRPIGLFGHTKQRKEIQSVHAQNPTASGVLGRIVDALTAQENPYRSKVYSMYGMQKLVEGNVVPTIIGGGGVVKFNQFAKYARTLEDFTGSESDSLFADTYAALLENSLYVTNRLSDALATVSLQGVYSGGTAMEQIARVMGLPHSYHESERDVFMVGVHSFDKHQGGVDGMTGLLDSINADLTALHTDLEAFGLWNATTVVTISDFGRTVSSNGLGTDHAWGGNNFIVGGSVKGGQIHGQFPEDLNPRTSELEVGRGRGVFIPTTPWEAMWYGLAQWLGVAEDRIPYVVPNAANFPDSILVSQDEMFYL